jgi:hypothetical protein
MLNLNIAMAVPGSGYKTPLNTPFAQKEPPNLAFKRKRAVD